MKNKEIAYQQVFLFGEEEIWSQLPPKVQEKALVLCAQMIMEVYRAGRKGGENG